MKVTIGISFYNDERYIKDAVQSVLNQDFKDFELIIIDNGSTDNSLNIVSKFTDSRIKMYHYNENIGFAARLNELVERANGKYFARMDADDIMHPERIKMQLEYFEQHPDIDVLGCGVFTIDIKNKIKGVIQYDKQPNSISNVYKHNCFMHPTIMAKTTWFLNNPYNENATRIEDYNLWMRTITTNKFVNMEEKLLFYRDCGLPYLSKYLISMRRERKELIKNKRRIHMVYVLILKNYVKCLAYSVFDLLHITDILIKMRSNHIVDNAIIDVATQELKRAISSPKEYI